MAHRYGPITTGFPNGANGVRVGSIRTSLTTKIFVFLAGTSVLLSCASGDLQNNADAEAAPTTAAPAASQQIALNFCEAAEALGTQSTYVFSEAPVKPRAAWQTQLELLRSKYTAADLLAPAAISDEFDQLVERFEDYFAINEAVRFDFNNVPIGAAFELEPGALEEFINSYLSNECPT